MKRITEVTLNEHEIESILFRYFENAVSCKLDINDAGKIIANVQLIGGIKK